MTKTTPRSVETRPSNQAPQRPAPVCAHCRTPILDSRTHVVFLVDEETGSLTPMDGLVTHAIGCRNIFRATEVAQARAGTGATNAAHQEGR